jgi:hypothetical protein
VGATPVRCSEGQCASACTWHIYCMHGDNHKPSVWAQPDVSEAPDCQVTSAAATSTKTSRKTPKKQPHASV